VGVVDYQPRFRLIASRAANTPAAAMMRFNSRKLINPGAGHCPPMFHPPPHPPPFKGGGNNIPSPYQGEGEGGG
jgi:hypothetical protein